MRGRKSIAQQPINALPRGEDLRAVARQRQAAFAIEHLPARDGHTELVGVNTERLPMGDERRLRDDAGATAGKLARHALVDIGLPAAPPQHQRDQKSAHRAADDQGASLHDTDTLLLRPRDLPMAGRFLYSAENACGSLWRQSRRKPWP